MPEAEPLSGPYLTTVVAEILVKERTNYCPRYHPHCSHHSRKQRAYLSSDAVRREASQTQQLFYPINRIMTSLLLKKNYILQCNQLMLSSSDLYSLFLLVVHELSTFCNFFICHVSVPLCFTFVPFIWLHLDPDSSKEIWPGKCACTSSGLAINQSVPRA